jgi:hypothetical protein
MADKQIEPVKDPGIISTKYVGTGSGVKWPLWKTVLVVGAIATVVLVFLELANR